MAILHSSHTPSDSHFFHAPQVGTGTSNLRRPNHGYHSACSNAVVRGLRSRDDGSSKQPRHTESVIFEGAQAYPSYLIYFAAA